MYSAYYWSIIQATAEKYHRSFLIHVQALSVLSSCLLRPTGSQEVCVWPAEPDPDLWRAPPREHHSHQHRRVAGAGGGFSLRGTFTLIPSPVWLPPSLPRLYLGPWLWFWPVSLVLQYVADLLHEQAQPIVSTCSAADVQAAFNTIVTRIQRLWVTLSQNLCVFNFIHVYTGRVPENSRKSSPAPWECLLYRVSRLFQFSSVLFLDPSAPLPSYGKSQLCCCCFTRFLCSPGADAFKHSLGLQLGSSYTPSKRFS